MCACGHGARFPSSSDDKGSVGTTLETLVLEYDPALGDFRGYKGGFLRRREVLR